MMALSLSFIAIAPRMTGVTNAPERGFVTVKG